MLALVAQLPTFGGCILKRYLVATVAAVLVTGGVAAAAVTFDQTGGTGFAGASDVKAALGLGNAKLDRKASEIQFRRLTITTAEITWVCGYFPTPEGPPAKTIDREELFIGTSAQSVSDTVARSDGAPSGFNLTGYSGDPTGTAHWFGPKPGSPGFGGCPRGWDLVQPPHASHGETSFLQVSPSGHRWANLLTLPS
jgi:hypothetical protein